MLQLRMQLLQGGGGVILDSTFYQKYSILLFTLIDPDFIHVYKKQSFLMHHSAYFYAWQVVLNNITVVNYDTNFQPTFGKLFRFMF